jgi:hypothetical protein
MNFQIFISRYVRYPVLCCEVILYIIIPVTLHDRESLNPVGKSLELNITDTNRFLEVLIRFRNRELIEAEGHENKSHIPSVARTKKSEHLRVGHV